MTHALLSLLRCPACGQKFVRAPASSGSGSVEDGTLVCGGGHSVQVRGGIPRFVADDGYVSSFSYEWQKHATTQLDSASGSGRSEKQFAMRLGKPLDWLRDKLVLDAGCGMGRFAEIAAAHGATVVALDFSFAIDVARTNLASWPNVHFVQADLLTPPFSPATFDVVYSFGVLHHTSDTRAAFHALACLVKPGGILSMFVYAAYNKAFVYSSDFWRKFSTRLPHKVLYRLCAAAIPLYYLYSIPFAGLIGKAVLPISMEPNWRWRWLDTFDWYSPKYQSKHTHAEVGRWFAEEGFDNLYIPEGEISMTGRKVTSSLA
jgi:SAM-dependent methyltransferase